MKRSWFCIHLSTAIATMFAASVLLWANVREAESRVSQSEVRTDGTYMRTDRRSQGWPFAANGAEITAPMLKSDTGELRMSGIVVSIWEPLYIAANILVAIVILFALAFLCEWRIRRHNPGRTS